MKDILIKILLSLCIISLLITILGQSIPKDSTDPVDGRSGLTIRIDQLTGCQYLSVYGGGIYPRMTKEGTQVCK